MSTGYCEYSQLSVSLPTITVELLVCRSHCGVKAPDEIYSDINIVGLRSLYIVVSPSQPIGIAVQAVRHVYTLYSDSNCVYLIINFKSNARMYASSFAY